MNDHLTTIGSLIPASLSEWTSTVNRGDDRDRQTNANNDLEAVSAWLSLHRDSPCTFSNYRKETSRFLLWCAKVAGKPMSACRVEDLLGYRDFLLNPPASFVGQKRPIGHPEWRPMTGALARSSVRSAFMVLNAMFAYLELAGYLRFNPVRLATRTRRDREPLPRRRPLPEDVESGLSEYIDSIEDRRAKVNARWVTRLLRTTGIRASEAIGAVMGDFSREQDKDGTVLFGLFVTGKGNKKRLVSVPNNLIMDLLAYRQSCGESATFPSHNNLLPVIGRLNNHRLPITRSALHQRLKRIFGDADEWLAARGHPAAGLVSSAHAHLFRHSAATAWLNNGANVAHVRDQLGQASITTTGIYITPDERDRMRSISDAS